MEKIISVPKDKKFFTVQELLDLGFSYYRIHKLVEEGILIKQSKKLYEIQNNQNFKNTVKNHNMAEAESHNAVTYSENIIRFKNSEIYKQ